MAFNGYCGGENKKIWGVSKMEHPLHELYIWKPNECSIFQNTPHTWTKNTLGNNHYITSITFAWNY
jgi:hypothetical protein